MRMKGNFVDMIGVDDGYFEGFKIPIRKNLEKKDYIPEHHRKARVIETRGEKDLDNYSIFIDTDEGLSYYAPSSYLFYIYEDVEFLC